jgi:hypothetical protein
LVSSETFVNSRGFNTASRNLSKDLRFSGGFLRSTILFETPFNLASEYNRNEMFYYEVRKVGTG